MGLQAVGGGVRVRKYAKTMVEAMESRSGFELPRTSVILPLLFLAVFRDCLAPTKKLSSGGALMLPSKIGAGVYGEEGSVPGVCLLVKDGSWC